MEKIFEIHVDMCKVFTNAKRLEILNTLMNKRDDGKRIDQEDWPKQGQFIAVYEYLEIEGSGSEQARKGPYLLSNLESQDHSGL